MRCFMYSSFVALFLFTFSSIANAGTPVPVIFSSGTPAKAADVNANFAALAARLDKLEGTTAVTMADLVGTYNRINMHLINYNGSQTAATVISTLTLAADGTGTEIGSNAVTTWSSTNWTTTAPSPTDTYTPINTTFTWTISGSTITFAGGAGGVAGTLNIAPGGKIFYRALGDNSLPNNHALMFIVRK